MAETGMFPRVLQEGCCRDGDGVGWSAFRAPHTRCEARASDSLSSVFPVGNLSNHRNLALCGATLWGALSC